MEPSRRSRTSLKTDLRNVPNPAADQVCCVCVGASDSCSLRSESDVSKLANPTTAIVEIFLDILRRSCRLSGPGHST